MTIRQKQRRLARIAFGALAITLIPTTVAFQDLGALLAGQPAVAGRARAHLISSPFGTIHAAMFSMPRPVGTAMPPPPVYALANFDPSDITGSIGAEPLGDPSAPLRFPTVNRKTKGDSKLSRARAPMPPMPDIVAPASADSDAAKNDKVVRRFEAYSDYEFPQVAEPSGPAEEDGAGAAEAAQPEEGEDRLFFGGPLAATQKMSPWAPGEAPVVTGKHVSGDYDIKLSALEPSPPLVETEGQSVAPKGQVTGAEQRPKSPAERLGLSLNPKSRAKSEKCLADAIYFESRDEPVRAQIAVAQVVMNRVFSPFYPKEVCGVVFQNAHRRLGCQFTFACDGTSRAIIEPSAWSRAQRIARDVLDGKLWMPEVAKSTHYHDWYVHPNWVGEMKKMDRLGGLIFYRPKRWGDGSSEPHWGDAKTTEAEAKRL